MNYAIIAAGEGSRLQKEGVGVAKPMVRIGGIPMIGRLIGIFSEFNPESISVILNPAQPETLDYIKKLPVSCPLRITVKSTPGSLHSLDAMNLAANAGKTIVTTVDTIFSDADFRAYAAAFESDACSDALMAVTPLVDDEKPLWVAADTETSVVEAFLDKATEKTRLVSGGIYGLTPACFRIARECVEAGVTRMRDFQRALLESKMKVKAYTVDSIFDVDHADDITKAENLVRQWQNHNTTQPINLHCHGRD